MTSTGTCPHTFRPWELSVECRSHFPGHNPDQKYHTSYYGYQAKHSHHPSDIDSEAADNEEKVPWMPLVRLLLSATQSMWRGRHVILGVGGVAMG